MKKAAGVALILLLLAVGCGYLSPAQSPLLDEPFETSTEISLWSTVIQEHIPIFEDAIAQFTAENPGVNVTFVNMDGEAYKARIRVMAASNQLPDVFNYWVGEQFNSLVRSGNVRDLTDMMNPDFRDSFLPGSLEALTIDDRIYGIPSAITYKMIFYNRRIFYENDLTAPVTYNELLQAIDILAENGVTPIVIGGMDRWPFLGWFAYLAQRIGGTQLYMDAVAGNASFAEPPFVQAGEYFRDLAERGFMRGAMAIDATTADAIFASGGGAMMLMGAWAIPVYTACPYAAGDFGFFPFPVIESGIGGSGYLYGGIANAFAMSNAVENPNEAQAFLMFLMGENIQAHLMETSGGAPTVEVSPNRDNMIPLAYEFSRFLFNESVTGFFPYTDQAVRADKAERLLNAMVAIFLDSDADIKAELERIR